MASDNLTVNRPQTPLTNAPAGAETVQQVAQQTSVTPPSLDAAAATSVEGNLPSAGPTLAAPRHTNAADLMTLLYALQQKHSESSIETAETNIHLRADDKALKNADSLKKLEKIAKNSTSVGAIFQKIFAWVGVALSFVVAGIVGVVSGGAAAAPLLALAVVSAGVLLMQQTGGMDAMMDAMGMDDKAKMGFSLAVTAVMLVANIGATIATGGASGISSLASSISGAVTKIVSGATEAVAEGAAEAVEMSTMVAEQAVELGEQVAETAFNTAAEATEAATAATEGATTAAETATEAATSATEAATTASEEVADAAAELGKVAAKSAKSAKMLTVGTKLQSVIQVVSGGTMIVGGSVGIDTAKKQYDSTMARADVQQNKAELAKLMALDEEDARRIRQMIEQLQNASSMVVDTLSAADETALRIRSSV